MKELEREYIKKFLKKISEDIEEKEIKFNKVKDLEKRIRIIDKLLGTGVHKGEFIKLYNEVCEARKEYVEKLKVIHYKYYKDIIDGETNEK